MTAASRRDLRPSRSSALRAALAVSSALPTMEITMEVDHRGELRVLIFGLDDPSDRRIADTRAVATHLDAVTEVLERPGSDGIYVRVRGRLGGTRAVEIATFLDLADMDRLDVLLAPLRALVRTGDGKQGVR